jgi:hypothetical protein
MNGLRYYKKGFKGWGWMNRGTTMLFLENFLHNKEDTMRVFNRGWDGLPSA